MRLFIQPLDQTHRTLFEDFEAEDENVGRDSYKTYLKVNAEADQRKGNARTYLAIEENDEGKRTLVGFYEKCHFKKLPGYGKHIPRNDSNSDCVGMYLNLQPK